MQLTDSAAAKYITGCAGSLTAGVTIGQVNQYLQAVAFIVGIISGSCAAYYYFQKSRRKDGEANNSDP